MSIARALRFGARHGVISFEDGEWWWLNMCGGRVGPINRRDAYLTAISYMNAREIADYDIPRADLNELHQPAALDAGNATSEKT